MCAIRTMDKLSGRGRVRGRLDQNDFESRKEGWLVVGSSWQEEEEEELTGYDSLK